VWHQGAKWLSHQERTALWRIPFKLIATARHLSFGETYKGWTMSNSKYQ
jgi:hypothetical protein